MTRVIDFFFDFRIRDLLSEENKSKGIEFYPLTARRLRPLRWEMNCVCYLLDRAL